MRPLGTLRRKSSDVWRIEADPHVTDFARRLFPHVSVAEIVGGARVAELTHSAETCRDLEWFMMRYPLSMSAEDRECMEQLAATVVETEKNLTAILAGIEEPRPIEMLVPARRYQLAAAQVFTTVKKTLLGDPMGLGKTVTAIAAISTGVAIPAVVVCLPGIRTQWEDEFHRFAPRLTVHKITTSCLYPLPKADVYIVSWGTLVDWAKSLAKIAKMVILDETQELRTGPGTGKYNACATLVDNIEYRLGMSATPIYNSGTEVWNVYNIIAPGRLGTLRDFQRRWCGGGKNVVEPDALKSWLRQEMLYVRRSRIEVGRELPPTIYDLRFVESNQADFKETLNRSQVQAAASGALSGEFGAGSRLDQFLRIATGLGKAKAVAATVAEIADGGEKVVLFGWHREVFSIWLKELRKFKPAMYTGSESPAMKAREVQRFVDGDSSVLIVSNRAGVGLDGLQEVATVAVIGEIDWCSAVVEQNIGRIARDKKDGSTNQVTAVVCVGSLGLDATIMEATGAKFMQGEGIFGDDATSKASAAAKKFWRSLQ